MTSSDQSVSSIAEPARSDERRRSLRHPISAAVDVVDVQTESIVRARTSDVGLGGCYVDTMNPYPVESKVRIRIFRDEETFEAEGKVVYARAGMGMGIAFVSALPGQVRLFQRWIREAGGDHPAPAAALIRGPEPPAAAAATPTFLKTAVLSDLILTLIHNHVLAESEGRALLKKLFS